MAYVVSIVAQFISSPQVPHLVAAKRILRYAKGTLDQGRTFCPQTRSTCLCACSNEDWAGCPDTCRSTSGYLIYIG